MKKSKKILSLIILTSTIFTFAGCAKYEKDESYDTDLYGSYLHTFGSYNDDNTNQTEESSIQYYLNEMYQFNSDNTYQLTGEQIIDETTQDINEDGKILSVEEISDDIFKIILDKEIVNWSTNEVSNQIIYKYKNMIGDFSEIEVPNGKTFELHLSDYVWYDKDGQYHAPCNGNDNCNCSDSCPKYIRKDNVIYFQSMDELHKDCYTIGAYIVDDGVFFPTFYKTE